MITVTVEEREGAPAYVAKGHGLEFWSFASHFVENQQPLSIIQSWSDQFEMVTGSPCAEEIIAAIGKIKEHDHLDDVTVQQIKDMPVDFVELSTPRVLES